MAFSTVFDKYSPQPIKNIKCELQENLICYFCVVFKIVEDVFFLCFLHCWGTELWDVGCFVVFE